VRKSPLSPEITRAAAGPMTASRTLFLVGAAFAMGLLLIGTSAYVDYAGAARVGLPWYSDIIVRDGCAYYVVDATAGGDPEDIRLAPLTPNEYQTRLSWGIVSGVLMCLGILVLATGHFLLGVCYASPACGWMIPSTSTGRVLLTCYLCVLYVLGVAVVSTDVMGAKVSGTAVESRLIAEMGAYYVVKRGGGPSRLRIPICEAQYQERKRWERISAELGNMCLMGGVPLTVFFAVKGFAYVRTRRNRRDTRGGSG